MYESSLSEELSVFDFTSNIKVTNISPESFKFRTKLMLFFNVKTKVFVELVNFTYTQLDELITKRTIETEVLRHFLKK